MTTQHHEIETWLGDDHGLTAGQVEELTRIADDIHARYPGEDDRDEREAALIAACRVMLEGAAVVDELGAALRRGRTGELRAMAGLRQAALMLVGDAETQAGFARRAGVDRMTVRDWLGLR